jgi:Tfp pilus assembly protein PilN
MRAVNLLPTTDAGDGRRLPAVPVLVGCVGVVLVTAVLAVMFLSASSNVAKQRSALEQAQADFAAIPAPPVAPAIDSELPELHQARVIALEAALGQRVTWDRLLREVSQIVPSDVWLTTLSATAPSGPPVAATTPSAPATGFSIAGCTYSQESVARFLARLYVVPDLSSMTLGSSGGGGSCPPKMLGFTVTGGVRAQGATS